MKCRRARCEQTPRDPIHARFLETLHRILVADLGHWDSATAVLEEANRRAPWTRPSDQRAYHALTELHFNRIFFTEYELRRQAAAVRGQEDGH